MIGAHDLIIVATVLDHGYAVLTTNTAELARAPDLVGLAPPVA